MKKLLLLTSALVLAAAPAHADPITGAITAISGIFSAIGSTAVGSFLLRTGVSIGLSLLGNMIGSKSGQQTQPGISTTQTLSGGTNPQVIMLGKYATAGCAVCPPMTHGDPGSSTIDYLTYVIDVSDFRITSIDAVFINGERQEFTSPGNSYGDTASGTRFNNAAWLTWYDGTQTEADPELLKVYAGYERPWTANHILTGVAYAALTFKYNQDVYDGFPEVLFEVQGAPLYDPRKDDSLGGVGSHRWDDQSTWEFSENPIVMVYNILRGITLADGNVYGLNATEESLPIDRWVAAMNVCDEQVDVPGGTETRYKAALEVQVSTQPLDTILDLLKACGGQIAECGGVWNVTAGPAVLPRASFTDDDIIVSSDRDFRPFRGLQDTYNGIQASYPSPDAIWKAIDAPPYLRSDWESEDEGRRLTASLNLPSVPFDYQAQRVMIETVSDNRRMITHSVTLPPSALGLLPLDTITWTSVRNGYTNKLFEITSKSIDPLTLCSTVGLRERDPADYEYDYTTLTKPDPVPALPGNNQDGAPEDGTPDDSYTVGGSPATTVRPSPTIADLIQLHDTGVSRSTDGGARWVRYPDVFSGASGISAVRGIGYLVTTTSGQALLSKDLRAWLPFTFDDLSEIDVGIENGDFETGDLTGWTLDTGSQPAVLGTNAPAQRSGSQYYVTRNPSASGDGQFKIGQVVSLPAPADKRLSISVDVFADAGCTGTLSVQHISQDTYEFGDVVAPPWIQGNTNRNSSSFASLTLNGTNGIVSLRELHFKVDNYNNTTNQIPELLSFKFNDADGSVWSGQFSKTVASSSIGDADFVFSSGALKQDLTITLTNSVSVNQISLNIPAGWKPPIGWINTAGGELMSTEIATGSSPPAGTGYPVAVAATNGGTVTSAYSSTTGEWETISIDLDGYTDQSVTVFLEASGSPANVYFDNVRATVGDNNGRLARCVARDLYSRRHLVATATSLYEITGPGAKASLGSIPIDPAYLAANHETIIIARGTDIAISTDNGATWSSLTASSSVVQLIARPQAIAVLADGSVMSVSSSGLSSKSSLGSEVRIERDFRLGQWIAVFVDDGTLKTSSDLVTWTDADPMPASAAANSYRLVATDIGRKVGWRKGSRDLFNRDLSGSAWTVSPPSVDSAVAIQELK